MAKYADWIYVAVGLALIAGSVTIYNTTEWSAKRVLIKGCDYWEGKGQAYWCQEPMINQLEITKCGKQLYKIETNNNPCSDLIVTGGGGQRYYTKWMLEWSDEKLDACNIPTYKRNLEGYCIR